MLIEYEHSSMPGKLKLYDTKLAKKNNPCIHMTQEEFDEHELRHLKKVGHQKKKNIMADMMGISRYSK